MDKLLTADATMLTDPTRMPHANVWKLHGYTEAKWCDTLFRYVFWGPKKTPMVVSLRAEHIGANAWLTPKPWIDQRNKVF
jgi:hypothetical protein